MFAFLDNYRTVFNADYMSFFKNTVAAYTLQK